MKKNKALYVDDKIVYVENTKEWTKDFYKE